MPVVAAEERRVDAAVIELLARRGEQVVELVRVSARDVGEGDAGETPGGVGVEPAQSLVGAMRYSSTARFARRASDRARALSRPMLRNTMRYSNWVPSAASR